MLDLHHLLHIYYLHLLLLYICILLRHTNTDSKCRNQFIVTQIHTQCSRNQFIVHKHGPDVTGGAGAAGVAVTAGVAATAGVVEAAPASHAPSDQY